MLLRLLCLAIYVIGFIALRVYLRKHPPLSKRKYLSPYFHLLFALIWMWGSLLWFLPGLIWIGIISVPGKHILILSFFIPLGIFTAFLLLVGAFTLVTTSVKDFFKSLKPLVIPGLLAFVSAVFVLQTFLEVPYYAFDRLHFLLFLTFVCTPPVISVLFVLIWVPDFIPLDEKQEQRWPAALKLFVGFYTTFHKPVWGVEDGKHKTHIKGNHFMGFGPGWLMTEPENAVVLQGGTDIKRVVGPGIVLTEGTESPFQVVDLRNQIRIDKIIGMTRDGIEVKLPISSLFRINRGKDMIDDKEIPIDLARLERHEPWPYRDKRDIFHVVFAEEVDPSGKTPLEAHEAQMWDDRPLIIAKNQLKRLVSEYDFKDLYGKKVKAGPLTRSLIGAATQAAVGKALPSSYEILGGGVGNKIVPNDEQVAKQQVAEWQADLTDQVTEWQVEAQIDRLTTFTNVRSEARVNLLSKLLTETQENFQEVANTSDYVAYHLLENLLHMARNAEVKEELPASAIPTLVDLQQQTQGEQ